MKSAVIALFLGATSAIKMQDADPYFNEPTWTERMASAGGFIQLSACVNANADGVTCAPPNRQLFATGMNGDEDLGQDIIMKGKPFHYDQKPTDLIQIEEAPVTDEAEKVSVLQTPIAGMHTSFYAQK